MRNVRRRFPPIFIFAALLLFLLSGCAGNDTAVPAVTGVEVQATAAAAATERADLVVSETAAPTPAADPTSPILTEADPALLETRLSKERGVRSGDEPGIDGVTISPVDGSALGTDLWLAHTFGIRSFEPLRPHVVSLHRWTDQGWVDVASIPLDCPDYLGENSVEAVLIEPSTLWFSVDGGVGAHGGCFDLLRWDGAALTLVASNQNASPGAGSVVDLNGDGLGEVLLNQTDPYVFCYACGVRLYNTAILRYEGDQLVEVALEALGADAEAALQEANQRAIELAEANLFDEALSQIENAWQKDPDNPTLIWNREWIRTHAEARRSYAEQGYPILGWLFYGDGDAAIAPFRNHLPEAIFSLESPLISGTPADGWEDILSEWIFDFTDSALRVEPESAAHHFLRGWAHFLTGQNDAAVDQVRQAADLAPGDPLFSAALAHLTTERSVATPTPPTPTDSNDLDSATVKPVRFAPGATVHRMRVEPIEGVPEFFGIEILGGQSLFVTARPDLEIQLSGPNGRPLSAVTVADALRFDIPAPGQYVLRVKGYDSQLILLHIPPLGAPVLSPDSGATFRFAPGTISGLLRVEAEDETRIFRIGLGAFQEVTIRPLVGDPPYSLYDPAGRPLTPMRTEGSNARYLVPRSGTYLLTVDFSENALLDIVAPPEGSSSPSLPANPPVVQEIRFAPGTSGAALDFRVDPGSPALYSLEAGAGQTLILDYAVPNITVTVLDGNRRALAGTPSDSGTLNFELPSDGEYLLILSGSGSGTMGVNIPPR